MRQLALAMLLALTGCQAGGADRAYPPPPEFARSTVCVVGTAAALELSVEIAEHEAQHIHGLMHREQLDERAGMLFVYPKPQAPGTGFWMYQVPIPLDVAFIDSDGRILQIETMRPCIGRKPRDCPIYYSQEWYRSALEVNGGFFARHGFGAGDRVLRSGEDGCAQPAA